MKNIKPFRANDEVEKYLIENDFICLCCKEKIKLNLDKTVRNTSIKQFTSEERIQIIKDVFEHYYLDESQRSIHRCMYITNLHIENEYPELLPLPDESFFENVVSEIPDAYKQHYRKAYYKERQSAFTKFLSDRALER